MNLFLTFNSQEERRRYGGSAFLEFQYCRLPAEAETREKTSIFSLKLWRNDSLYVRDDDVFLREYGNIFDCGVYNNGKRGKVDVYGINYYEPSLIDSILEKIRKEKPKDCESLLPWLEEAKNYNGFYIMGM